MNGLDFYNDRGDTRMAKGRLLLSLMSRDMVEDIVALVQWRGHAVVNDIFDTQSSIYDPGHPLAILSREYMADEDVPTVLLGLSTVLFGNMRKANSIGMDEYKDLLHNAYSIDEDTAEAIAKNVETYDVIPWKDKDGNFNWMAIGEKILEGLRKAANWLPERLGIPWEIDETQKYDRDFLYEMSRLGDAVAALNRRARLMTSQAQITMGMGMLATGDPDQGDVDSQVGEIFAGLTRRELHPSIYGNLAPLARLGKATKASKAVTVLKSAGYGVTPTGQLAATGIVSNPKAKSAVDKILAMKPGKAALLGAALGFAPTLAAKLVKMRKSTGDISVGDSEMVSEIADIYGDSIADAWIKGDIDGIVKAALNDASGDITVGDAVADRGIEEAMANHIAGDLGDLDPEVGGIFSRWKMNRAKKRFINRQRRVKRRAARQNARAADRDAAAQYRDMARQESVAKYRQEESDFDPSSNDRSTQPLYEEGAYPEDQADMSAASPLDNFGAYFDNQGSDGQ